MTPRCGWFPSKVNLRQGKAVQPKEKTMPQRGRHPFPLTPDEIRPYHHTERVKHITA